MNTLTGMDRSILGDMHKDAYGFRPSLEFWNRVERMTNAEVQALFATLGNHVDEELELDRVRELSAQADLEKLLRLNQDLGADSRETAFRWLMQARDLDISNSQDAEHFLWQRGIAQQFWPQYMAEMGFRMGDQFGHWVREVV